MSFLYKKYESFRKSSARFFLRNKDFSIISNNCWGGFVYQHFNMPYRSPFAGLYLFAADYIRLLADLEGYLSRELTFIPLAQSKYKKEVEADGTAHQGYPIALLGDLEIHFLHYPTEQEAAEKWYKRVKRINYDNLLVKFSERDGCTKEMIAVFDQMNFPRKVCLTSHSYSYPSVFRMNVEEGEIPSDEWAAFLRSANPTRFINRFY